MGIQSSAAFTPDAGELDPRLDHTIGRRGIQYLDWIKHPGFDWIRNQANGGQYSLRSILTINQKEVHYKIIVLGHQVTLH